MFPSVEEAKESVKKVGENLKLKLLPIELTPFIIGFTSNGRVSKGAQEIIDLLPHEIISPENIIQLFDGRMEAKRDRVYITIIESHHMYVRKDGENFEKGDFYKNPTSYKSVFAEKYIPVLSILYHCMLWDPKQPRIITLDEAHDLSLEGRFRLLGISDITCDVNGSIELLKKCTSIENPFYTIDPKTSVMEDSFERMTEGSILYHAVDHLPAEFPFDASKHFSDKLFPFIEKIVDSQYPSDFPKTEGEESLTMEIFNACETWSGKLMPKYQYLDEHLSRQFSDFVKN